MPGEGWQKQKRVGIRTGAGEAFWKEPEQEVFYKIVRGTGQQEQAKPKSAKNQKQPTKQTKVRVLQESEVYFKVKYLEPEHQNQENQGQSGFATWVMIFSAAWHLKWAFASLEGMMQECILSAQRTKLRLALLRLELKIKPCSIWWRPEFWVHSLPLAPPGSLFPQSLATSWNHIPHWAGPQDLQCSCNTWSKGSSLTHISTAASFHPMPSVCTSRCQYMSAWSQCSPIPTRCPDPRLKSHQLPFHFSHLWS